jgi:hypothetical protein
LRREKNDPLLTMVPSLRPRRAVPTVAAAPRPAHRNRTGESPGPTCGRRLFGSSLTGRSRQTSGLSPARAGRRTSLHFGPTRLASLPSLSFWRPFPRRLPAGVPLVGTSSGGAFRTGS